MPVEGLILGEGFGGIQDLFQDAQKLGHDRLRLVHGGVERLDVYCIFIKIELLDDLARNHGAPLSSVPRWGEKMLR